MADITLIQTNFLRKSILGRLVKPWADCSKLTGDIMKAFTLYRGPVVKTGILCKAEIDLDGNLAHYVTLGRANPNSVESRCPIPHTAIVDSPLPKSDWSLFRYLNNNIAHFIVKIVDQSPSKGVFNADFDECLKPIASGYCGQGPAGRLGGGFEYLVPMVPGDRIHFTILEKPKATPTRFVLEALYDELVVKLDTPSRINGNVVVMPKRFLTNGNL